MKDQTLKEISVRFDDDTKLWRVSFEDEDGHQIGSIFSFEVVYETQYFGYKKDAIDYALKYNDEARIYVYSKAGILLKYFFRLDSSADVA